MNIWFTSDTHFGHSNIAGAAVSNWDSGFRNFKSVDEMNKALICGINKYVKNDDVLWHLGDWSFGGVENILKFRNQIMCRNIHLILGNHDKYIKNEVYQTELGQFNPYDLFSSVSHTFTGKIGSEKFHLSHFAHRVWPGSHKGRIHLYGHSHNSLPDFGKSMDVGVDVAYHMFREWRPFNFNEIVRIMSKKITPAVDHHE